MSEKDKLIKLLSDDKYTRHKHSIIKWEEYNYILSSNTENEYMSGIDLDQWGKLDTNYRERWWHFESPTNSKHVINNEPPTLDDIGFSALCPMCKIPDMWGFNHKCGNKWSYHPRANILWIDDEYIGLNTTNEMLMKNYCWVIYHNKKINIDKIPNKSNEWDEVVKNVWEKNKNLNLDQNTAVNLALPLIYDTKIKSKVVLLSGTHIETVDIDIQNITKK